jgi:hypothetical protein
MAWIRIEDSMFRHRKIVEIPPHSKLLLIGSLCHCADQLTDGFISAGAAKAVARLLGVPWSAHKPLVACELWHEVAGGYSIHDYLDYQPSASQERQRREAEADPPGQPAGQQGGQPAGQQAGLPPGVPPPVPANATGHPDTRLLNLSSPTRTGRGEPLRDGKSENPKNQHPKTQMLIGRFLSICDQRPGAQNRLRAEAEIWIPHLLRHVDADVVDECIGRCAAAAHPPASAKYLAQAVRTHVRPASIIIPNPSSAA